MKASLVQIGNSKGIRIPKVLLKECNFDEQVEIHSDGKKLVIKPVSSKPRKDWDKAFSLMHKRKEDVLLLDEGIEDLEAFDWK